MQNEIFKEIEQKLGKENIKYNEPMSKHTSFKVGGNADIFINIKSVEQMLEILKINNKRLPITVVGNGTNLLVRDSGIRGIVVKYIAETVEVSNETVKIAAGISTVKLAMHLLKNNLSGFEFAGGIPRNARWSNIYECWSIWTRNKRYC